MGEQTDSGSGDTCGAGRFSARLAPWLGLPGLLISLGHITYPVWRDHINHGAGILGASR